MEPSEQAASVQQDTEKKRTSPVHSNAQVLIVDSHPAMSRILSRLVKKAGLSYAVARGGEEAISFCKDSNFELVLMEVNMTGTNGLEATKSIRALPGNYGTIPIVAVAARMTDTDIERYKANGLDEKLKKPVNEVNLLAVLGKYLSLAETASHNRPPKDDEIYAILDEDEMSLVNWDTVKEYSSIMKNDYHTMMGDFLKASPDLIGNMGEAIIDKDNEQIRSLAHQLKSTSLIFGAEAVSNAAAQLEILGKDNQLEHASQYYKELHMSFERVQPVLRKKMILMKSMH